MKKIFFLLTVALTCSVMAQAQVPEGDLRVYSRSGSFYDDDWMGGYSLGSQMGAAQIVFADDAVYLQNIFSLRNDDGWTAGTLNTTGDTITVQPHIVGDAGVYVETESGEYELVSGKIKLAMLKASDGTFVELPGMPIQYVVKENTVSLINTNADTIMGLVYCDFPEEKYNGIWNLQGNFETVYTLLEEKTISLPDGAIVEDYTITYSSPYNPEPTVEFVKMAFVGTDVYLGNFASSLPDAWVKGSIVENTVVFPSNQFLGVSFGYIARLLGTSYEMVDDEWGGQSPEYTRLESFVFHYDADTKVLTSEANQALLVNVSDEMIMTFNTFANPTLAPFVETPATPADPELVDVTDYYELEGDWCIFVNIPQVDVNGDAINAAKLSYIFYVDDTVYTFNAARYELEEDLTEIPVTMTGSSWINIVTYFGASTYLQENGFKKIGVQSIYRGGNEEHRSNIVSYEVPTALEQIEGTAATVNKFLRNGQVLIRKDGKTYNVLGAEVR